MQMSQCPKRTKHQTTKLSLLYFCFRFYYTNFSEKCQLLINAKKTAICGLFQIRYILMRLDFTYASVTKSITTNMFKVFVASTKCASLNTFG